MTRFWSGVVAATFLASVGVAAQNAPTPAGAAGAQGAQGRESSSSSQAGSQQKITVSGCIQNAPSATATATTGGGAAGAAGGATAGATATAGGQSFMLANAKMAGTAGAGGGAVGTSGTAATRYELDGEAKTISAHLNHQVEITGTLESSPAPSAGAASATAGSRAPAAPKLKVDSVKMVSATCQ